MPVLTSQLLWSSTEAGVGVEARPFLYSLLDTAGEQASDVSVPRTMLEAAGKTLLSSFYQYESKAQEGNEAHFPEPVHSATFQETR